MDIGRGGFLAGTLVATPKGPQRIERLRVGDLVVTMDTASGVKQDEALRAVFSGTVDELFTIYLTDGSTATSSKECRYWLSEYDDFGNIGFWWRAGSLRPNHHVLTANTTSIVVARAQSQRIASALVFGLTFDDNNNCFVGPSRVLVSGVLPYPSKAIPVLDYVLRTGSPPPNYYGGGFFSNLEGLLPRGGNYREYDIDPVLLPSIRRNRERIVVDTNTRQAWYTPDHYATMFSMP
jgi:guanyl-specific ribonuclease Sa